MSTARQDSNTILSQNDLFILRALIVAYLPHISALANKLKPEIEQLLPILEKCLGFDKKLKADALPLDLLNLYGMIVAVQRKEAYISIVPNYLKSAAINNSNIALIIATTSLCKNPNIFSDQDLADIFKVQDVNQMKLKDHEQIQDRALFVLQTIAKYSLVDAKTVTAETSHVAVSKQLGAHSAASQQAMPYDLDLGSDKSWLRQAQTNLNFAKQFLGKNGDAAKVFAALQPEESAYNLFYLYYVLSKTISKEQKDVDAFVQYFGDANNLSDAAKLTSLLPKNITSLYKRAQHDDKDYAKILVPMVAIYERLGGKRPKIEAPSDTKQPAIDAKITAGNSAQTAAPAVASSPPPEALDPYSNTDHAIRYLKKNGENFGDQIDRKQLYLIYTNQLFQSHISTKNHSFKDLVINPDNLRVVAKFTVEDLKFIAEGYVEYSASPAFKDLLAIFEKHTGIKPEAQLVLYAYKAIFKDLANRKGQPFDEKQHDKIVPADLFNLAQYNPQYARLVLTTDLCKYLDTKQIASLYETHKKHPIIATLIKDALLHPNAVTVIKAVVDKEKELEKQQQVHVQYRKY